MDKTMLNGSGYVDKTAYDAIIHAENENRQKEKLTKERDEAAETLIKTLKNMIRLSGFKLSERIKLEDPKTGRKYL